MGLNPLSVIRSPTARGLGEKIAQKSLPGPGKRYSGDQWALNRSPWAHPFMAGASGARFDKELLKRNALEVVAINGGLDPALVEDMTLEELLVLPAVQEVLKGAVIGVTRWPPPAPSLFEDVSEKYEVLKTGGAVTANIVIPDSTAVGATFTQSAIIPSQVMLDAVIVVCSGGTAGIHRNTAQLSGYGTFFDLLLDGSGAASNSTANLPIGHLIDSPRTLTITMRDVGKVAFDSGSMSAMAIYRNTRLLGA